MISKRIFHPRKYGYVMNAGSGNGESGLTWKYGLLGGIVAMPLTIADYVLFWSSDFPLTMVVVGGLVAGYLAAQHAGSAYRAGAVAGAVGSLPGLLLFLPTLYDTVTQWAVDGILFPLVGASLVVAFVLGVAAFAGCIGGGLGGWIASKRQSSGVTATHT